ncbi:alpha/beta hydrolase [Actinoplanes sp. NPDC023801]|uniref:alpha/beta hydrolase n=1 Tax=Actinoplanes sp. NPDC023801 TaxID=3154595 RepID=UPI0034091711
MIRRHSGLFFVEHTLSVPLNHADPQGPHIEIFAREVREADPVAEGRPFLLYLQGGPGNRSPRGLPVWLRRATRDYRVVLLDQRGTGLSTPLTRQTLARVADPAAHLAHFRADSIVADAELLRAHLAGDRPWSVEAFFENELSEVFLRRVDQAISFAEQPLFAVLHEAIYGQRAATGWAAHRVRDEFPAFDLDSGGPVRFTGEMIYPWLFEEDPALIPLAGAAGRLATKSDWTPLYDPERLATNKVPVVAAIYFDDMYVDRDMSLATAAAIGTLRPWVTSEYAHNGLGREERVLDRLLTMLRD